MVWSVVLCVCCGVAEYFVGCFGVLVSVRFPRTPLFPLWLLLFLWADRGVEGVRVGYDGSCCCGDCLVRCFGGGLHVARGRSVCCSSWYGCLLPQIVLGCGIQGEWLG